jgi:hypothetical protein
MITYIISNDQDPKEFYKFQSDTELDNPFEQALDKLGYRLNHNTDDGNVHEYVLIENESGKSVYQFMEYMYYRACFEALTELGYSCEPEDFYKDLCDSKSSPKTNVIPFEL